jgi:glucose uptake protein GlcU
MKRFFTSLTLTLGLMVSLLVPVFTPALASAQTTPAGGTGSGGSGINPFGGCQAAAGVGGDSSVCVAAGKQDFTTLMKNIINTILLVLGMIAVIMIIIGGIRYTTSNGESAQITSAKNTILYAVVGLVVAILAYAIVNFVVQQFSK